MSKFISFSPTTEIILCDKVDAHNASVPESFATDLNTVRAVYRRGALTSPQACNRTEIASNRVDAFLSMIKVGRPANALYTADNDLRPLIASAAREEADTTDADTKTQTLNDALSIQLKDKSEYSTPEDAILALTEIMGLGYEYEPSVRASWLRAVRTYGNPFDRARDFALRKYDSIDADLLPIQEAGSGAKA